MNDFDKAVLNFFADNEQTVLKEYRTYNGEYKRLCDENKKASITIKELYLNLDETEIKAIDEWKNIIYQTTDKEKDFLYLQGFKDCIKLLQLINLIWLKVPPYSERYFKFLRLNSMFLSIVMYLITYILDCYFYQIPNQIIILYIILDK